MAETNIPSPSPWQPNDTAPVCMLCKRGFNIFRWRHHCRICGKVFCNFCTPHRARVRGYLDLERICILCKSATLNSTRNMTVATSVVPHHCPPQIIVTQRKPHNRHSLTIANYYLKPFASIPITRYNRE